MSQKCHHDTCRECLTMTLIMRSQDKTSTYRYHNLIISSQSTSHIRLIKFVPVVHWMKIQVFINCTYLCAPRQWMPGSRKKALVELFIRIYPGISASLMLWYRRPFLDDMTIINVKLSVEHIPLIINAIWCTGLYVFGAHSPHSRSESPTLTLWNLVLVAVLFYVKILNRSICYQIWIFGLILSNTISPYRYIYFYRFIAWHIFPFPISTLFIPILPVF